MKLKQLLTITCMAAGASFYAGYASAGNSTIEDALKSRENLSAFYQGLVNTGVINELDSGASYTVFAPTNDAMKKISQDKYPCFYSQQCADEVADILRNHIVKGEVAMGTTGPTKTGVFSIDGEHLALGTVGNRDYTVNGKEIETQHQLLGSVLYEIDGVIAEPQELSDVGSLKYVHVPVATPVAQQTVQEQMYYAPDGRPDGYSRTVTTTQETPVVITPAY